ncbi:beta-1,4-N-acetylgalactosaminyltransferase 3 [Aulostomus maculatus]
MIRTFFPLKKLRRNLQCLLFGAILLVGALAVYHELVAAKAWSGGNGMNPDADGSSWRGATLDERVKEGYQLYAEEDSDAWRSSFIPQAWKSEYKGQANLHVFEDWCGSSTVGLRKNLHYPLYPHSRSTVQKLAVSPQWTNYGLRIFGYIHPYADGEFVFALSSDDNSEFWLSTDDSPLNLQLLAWVGTTGAEWTAPGEFEKYASQTSKPARLSTQKRYFFEIIHKQNDRGTDHVEVAWRLLDQGFRFMMIESRHISLYVNESALLMSDVAHIPQTAASHQHTPAKKHSASADILREDPRDTLYKLPLIDRKFLQGVLPDCSYKPSYTIKDFPLLRYQGLQFVHMSYIYPNDFTRLTHMEEENSCFYPENPFYMKMFGFSRYMILDHPDGKEKGNTASDFGFQERKSVLEEDDKFDDDAFSREKQAKWDQRINNALYSDYGDDYDDYVQKRKRKLFSVVTKEPHTLKSSQRRDEMQRMQGKDNVRRSLKEPGRPAEPLQSVPTQENPPHQQQNQKDLRPDGPGKKIEYLKQKGRLKLANRKKLKAIKAAVKSAQTDPLVQVDREKLGAKEQPLEHLGYNQRHIQKSRRMSYTQIQEPKARDAPVPHPTEVHQRRLVNGERELQPAAVKHFTTPNREMYHPPVKLNQRDTDPRKSLREKEIKINMPLQQDLENRIHQAEMITKDKLVRKWSEMNAEEEQLRKEDEFDNRAERRRDTRRDDRDSLWGPGEEFEGADDEDLTPAPVFDTEVNWSQTFQVNQLDLQALRSDWIDLRCNISGNLLLHSSDALPMVSAFMEKLGEKHPGRFTLLRVVNVEKRIDGVQGSRYLLELELRDVNDQLLRLSHYIYALIRHSGMHSKDLHFKRSKPQLLLCNPVGFRWNPVATVHFIVPVKNQARWVQKLIKDMEELFRATGDANFNLIITDYNSTDMDVRKALEKSSLPRYQYVKLGGNFERSAGLQAGVNLINDDHSIVFLCDLHIQFPPSIIETIRKHCVEGYMAFAPIVMRLDCGATLHDARGYWEVNGFGLLGIYKSDLDAVGGMNTKEFTDRWGGEDWELLDRILQAGLEVERIYLRNFFHHYHSKRGMWNRRMSHGLR